MKHIYVLTEDGVAWNQDGVDWIENVLKPDLGEAGETLTFFGKAACDPQTLLKDLGKRPDSYVVISHRRIAVLTPAELPQLCEALEASVAAGDGKNSWIIAMEQFVL